MPCRAGIEVFAQLGQVARHARRDGHAGLEIADGRGQRLIQPGAAVPFRELAKGVDGARQGDRGGVALFDRGQAGVAQGVGVQPGRRAARAVERDDIIRPRRFDQCEAVAADPGHVRLADAQQHRARDGGVDGIAARFQNIEGFGSGKRVRRGDHAAGCQHQGAAGQVKVSHVSSPFFARDRSGTGAKGNGKACEPRHRELGGG